MILDKPDQTIKEKLRIKITDTGSGANVLTDDEKFAELNKYNLLRVRLINYLKMRPFNI